MSHPRDRISRKGPPQLEILEDRSLPSAGPVGAIDPGPTESHVLVQYQPGAPHAPLLPGATEEVPLGVLPDLYKVTLAPDVSVEAALAAYRADPGVRLAEPDGPLQVSSVPSDPLFTSQWALDNTGQGGGTPGADIGAVGAWDVATGSPVLVSLMDTGIDYSHPDLYRNVAIDQGEIPASRRANLLDVDGDGTITFRDLADPQNQGPGKITDLDGNGRIDARDLLAPMQKDANGQDTGLGGWADGLSQDGDRYVDDLVGWNFFSNTNDPFDDNGHGTHVGGILAATGNDGFGVAGVVWQAQILPVKFLGPDGNGSVSQFLVGLQYALDQGVKISNNSWVGASNSQILYDALDQARSQGHIVVAAAGNRGADGDQAPNYPSSFPLDNIVAVTATDRNDHRASFANYGATSVDLGAPGADILSTQPDGGDRSLSGTSMATPFVTGAVALVWGQNPSWSYRQVIDRILSTVDPLADLQGKTVSGGRLNLARALGVTDPGDSGGNGSQEPVSNPSVVGSEVLGPEPGVVDHIRIHFDRAIDTVTFTISDVHITGPAGRAVTVESVRAVPGSGNEVYEIRLAPQTEPGEYTVEVGPDVRDNAGHQLTAVFRRTFTIAGDAPRRFTRESPDPIPAGRTSVSLLQIDEDVPIGDLNVELDYLRHPFTGDLRIFLQGPNGLSVVLADHRGGRGADFQGTVFDDEATASIGEGQAPFTGSFRPEESLSAFDGISTRGYWKLWVENRIGPADGRLQGWALVVTPKGNSPPPPPVSGFANPHLPIPDVGQTVSVIRIDADVPIDHVMVGLNVDHPRVGDLHVSLQAPDGTLLDLARFRGGEGDGFQGTFFDDTAGRSIAEGQPPFTGAYRPETALAYLDGKSTRGYWKLWIEDRTPGASGVLVNWSLLVNGGGANAAPTVATAFLGGAEPDPGQGGE
jgi:subtilisin family serine protease/subtilisin-like proprotein convertase family protein